MNTGKTWTVGQRVYCLICGYGTITRIENLRYPILVTFDSKEQQSYTMDGKLDAKHPNIILYHYKPDIVKPKIKVKKEMNIIIAFKNGALADVLIEDISLKEFRKDVILLNNEIKGTITYEVEE